MKSVIGGKTTRKPPPRRKITQQEHQALGFKATSALDDGKVTTTPRQAARSAQQTHDMARAWAAEPKAALVTPRDEATRHRKPPTKPPWERPALTALVRGRQVTKDDKRYRVTAPFSATFKPTPDQQRQLDDQAARSRTAVRSSLAGSLLPSDRSYWFDSQARRTARSRELTKTIEKGPGRRQAIARKAPPPPSRPQHPEEDGGFWHDVGHTLTHDMLGHPTAEAARYVGGRLAGTRKPIIPDGVVNDVIDTFKRGISAIPAPTLGGDLRVSGGLHTQGSKKMPTLGDLGGDLDASTQALATTATPLLTRAIRGNAALAGKLPPSVTRLLPGASVIGLLAALPPRVRENASKQLAETVAGAPYGLVHAVGHPTEAYKQMRDQYVKFYGPLLRGDIEAFKESVENYPLQIPMDLLAIATGGEGTLARLKAVNKAFREPELAANVTRASAVMRAALFRQEHWIENGNVRFGRRPELATQKVAGGGDEQRLLPASGIGQRYYKNRAIKQSAEVERRGPLEISRLDERRATRLVRATEEMQSSRSAAHLGRLENLAARYSTGPLNAVARRMGLRPDARPIVAATAWDRTARYLGDDPNDLAPVIESIQNEIATKGERYKSEPTQALQSTIKNLQDALSFVKVLHREKNSRATKRFLSDVGIGRRYANEAQQYLLDEGLLNPDTAARAASRELKSVQQLERVPDSPIRESFENIVTDLMRSKGVDDIDAHVAAAMDLLDSAALSHQARGQGSPTDFYEQTFERVMAVPEVGKGSLHQVANVDSPYEGMWPRDSKQVQNRVAKRAEMRETPLDYGVAEGSFVTKEGVDTGLQMTGNQTPDAVYNRALALAEHDVFSVDNALEAANFYSRAFEDRKGATAPLRRLFGDQKVLAWLVSQKGASPARGFLDLMRIMDHVERGADLPRKWIEEKIDPRTGKVTPGRWQTKIGLAAKEMRALIDGVEKLEAGAGAKISDFIDSALHKETRTWMGNRPDGGPPSVVDRWQYRSRGGLDEEMINDAAYRAALERSGVDTQKLVDEDRLMKVTASLEQYEDASVWLEQATQILNAKKLWRRERIEKGMPPEWTAAETQALDWASIQYMFDKPPETIDFALAAQTHEILLDAPMGTEQLRTLVDEAVARPNFYVETAERTPENLAIIGLDVNVTGNSARISGIMSPESAQAIVQHLIDGGVPGVLKLNQSVPTTHASANLSTLNTHLVRLRGNARKRAKALKTTFVQHEDMNKHVIIHADGNETTVVFRTPDEMRSSPHQRRDAIIETIGLEAKRAGVEFLREKARGEATRGHGDYATNPNQRAAYLDALKGERTGQSAIEMDELPVGERDGYREAVLALPDEQRPNLSMDTLDAELAKPDNVVLMTPEADGGLILTPQADIRLVFSSGGGKAAPMIAKAVAEAEKRGQVATLDAFDGHLPPLYSAFGFREAARLGFDERSAPPGAGFTVSGRPDIVFMAHADELPVQRAQRVATVAEGRAAQRALTEEGPYRQAGPPIWGQPDPEMLYQVHAPKDWEAPFVEAAESRDPVGPLELHAADGAYDGYVDYTGEMRNAARLPDGYRAYNLIDQQGELLGSVVFDLGADSHWVYVDSLYIRPAFRGRRDVFQNLVDPVLRESEQSGRKIVADFLDPKFERLLERARDRGLVHQQGKLMHPYDKRFDPEQPYAPPRGGALVRANGSKIELAPTADLTTVIHEVGHAVMPAAFDWLVEHQPGRGAALREKLGLKEDDKLTSPRSKRVRDAHERFAYTVEMWSSMGKPPITQLRDTFRLIKSEHAARLRGRVPAEHRDAVQALLEDPDFMSFVNDLFDPTYGVTVGEASFFIPRQPPSAYTTLDRLIRPRSISPSRERVRQSENILFTQGREEPGPRPVLHHANRWRRRADQQDSLNRIRASHAKPLPLDETGRYDFAAMPENGWVVFNPDGLRGWTRYMREEQGRAHHGMDDTGEELMLEGFDNIDPNDLYDVDPADISAESVRQAQNEAQFIFAEGGEASLRRGNFPRDPREGELMMVPIWVRDKWVGEVARGMTGTVARHLLDSISSGLSIMNALQRIRMYLGVRYVMLNVAATGLLNVMHQGLFQPINFGIATRIARGHPELWDVLQAESGAYSGSVGAYRVAAPGRGWARTFDDAATALGHVVGKPEAFLRTTSIIHHLRRAGFRTADDMLDFATRARKGEGNAREIMNQIAFNAENDVIRFRGLPPTEQDVLRKVIFVSGWYTAAVRFALRYPIDHPMWTYAAFQFGDDGWEEMREMFEPYTASTMYGIAYGPNGVKDGKKTVSISDLNQLLPFSTAADIAALGGPLPYVGKLFDPLGTGQAQLSDRFGASWKLVDALTHGLKDKYGRPITAAGIADDFLISNTPLDYVFDFANLHWVGHERTPNPAQVDSMKDYLYGYFLGRMAPTRFYADELKSQWANAQSQGGAHAERTAKDWADQVEVRYGVPPDATSVRAIRLESAYRSAYGRKRDDLKGAAEADKMLVQAQEKAKILRDEFGKDVIPAFNAPDSEELLATVDEYWDVYVRDPAHEARAIYDLKEDDGG